MPKFEKGKSGNPRGRPKGTRNALTILRLQMDAELRRGAIGVLKKIIAQANQGCLKSQEWILNRLLPVSLYESAVSKGRALVNVELKTVTGQPVIHLTEAHGPAPAIDREPAPFPDEGVAGSETLQDSGGGPSMGEEHAGGVGDNPRGLALPH